MMNNDVQADTDFKPRTKVPFWPLPNDFSSSDDDKGKALLRKGRSSSTTVTRRRTRASTIVIASVAGVGLLGAGGAAGIGVFSLLTADSPSVSEPPPPSTSDIVSMVDIAQDKYNGANGTLERPDYASLVELQAEGFLPDDFNDGENPVALQLHVFDRADGDGEGFHLQGTGIDQVIYTADDGDAGPIKLYGIQQDYEKARAKFG